MKEQVQTKARQGIKRSRHSCDSLVSASRQDNFIEIHRTNFIQTSVWHPALVPSQVHEVLVRHSWIVSRRLQRFVVKPAVAAEVRPCNITSSDRWRLRSPFRVQDWLYPCINHCVTTSRDHRFVAKLLSNLWLATSRRCRPSWRNCRQSRASLIPSWLWLGW